MGGTASVERCLAGRRILVVEDDYLIATDLTQALRDRGAEVVGPVPSIAAALHLIRTTPEMDAALLDVNLGGEMAFPVADALLQHGVPFAFATGYSQDMIPARFAGVIRHEKPLDLARVADALLA